MTLKSLKGQVKKSNYPCTFKSDMFKLENSPKDTPNSQVRPTFSQVLKLKFQASLKFR